MLLGFSFDALRKKGGDGVKGELVLCCVVVPGSVPAPRSRAFPDTGKR